MRGVPYGICPVILKPSASRSVVRNPALFRECLAWFWPLVSRRILIVGRGAEVEADRSPDGVDVGCLALFGVFLLAREGDGDDVEEIMPFVWMPGGAGRLILVATDADATAVAGDMVSGQTSTRAATGSQRSQFAP